LNLAIKSRRDKHTAVSDTQSNISVGSHAAPPLLNPGYSNKPRQARSTVGVAPEVDEFSKGVNDAPVFGANETMTTVLHPNTEVNLTAIASDAIMWHSQRPSTVFGSPKARVISGQNDLYANAKNVAVEKKVARITEDFSNSLNITDSLVPRVTGTTKNAEIPMNSRLSFPPRQEQRTSKVEVKEREEFPYRFPTDDRINTHTNMMKYETKRQSFHSTPQAAWRLDVSDPPQLGGVTVGQRGVTTAFMRTRRYASPPPVATRPSVVAMAQEEFRRASVNLASVYQAQREDNSCRMPKHQQERRIQESSRPMPSRTVTFNDKDRKAPSEETSSSVYEEKRKHQVSRRHRHGQDSCRREENITTTVDEQGNVVTHIHEHTHYYVKNGIPSVTTLTSPVPFVNGVSSSTTTTTTAAPMITSNTTNMQPVHVQHVQSVQQPVQHVQSVQQIVRPVETQVVHVQQQQQNQVHTVQIPVQVQTVQVPVQQQQVVQQVYVPQQQQISQVYVPQQQQISTRIQQVVVPSVQTVTIPQVQVQQMQQPQMMYQQAQQMQMQQQQPMGYYPVGVYGMQETKTGGKKSSKEKDGKKKSKESKRNERNDMMMAYGGGAGGNFGGYGGGGYGGINIPYMHEMGMQQQGAPAEVEVNVSVKPVHGLAAPQYAHAKFPLRGY